MSTTTPALSKGPSRLHSIHPLVRKITGVAGVMGVSAIAQVGLQIFLGITLGTKSEVGQWALTLSLVTSLAAVGLCGTANGWSAWFSREGTDGENWVAALKARSRIMLPLTLVAVIVAMFVFRLTPLVTLCLALGASSFVLKECLSIGLLRARHHFLIAALLQKLWIFITLAGVALLWKLATLSATSATIVLSISLFVTALITVYVTKTRCPHGDLRPSPESSRLSLIYWPISLSLIASRHLDKLMLSGFVDFDATGSYAMILALMGGYEILTAGVGFVLLPHFNRQNSVPIGRVILLLLLPVVCAGVFYFFFGSPVAHLIFADTYDDAIHLIPVFILAGSLRFLGVLPGSLIGARLGADSLVVFSKASVAMIPLSALLMWYLVGPWGMTGAAWAVVFTEAMRTVLSYSILFRFRDRLRRHS